MRVRSELVTLSLLALGLGTVLGCPAEDPQLGDPPANGSGPTTMTAGAGNSAGSGVADDTDTDSDTGVVEDMGTGCDPWADPLEECGENAECSFETLECSPTTGTGITGDPCTSELDCSPGLVCTGELCAQPCDITLLDEEDPNLPGACADGEVCAAATDPIPGICLTECNLVAQDCAGPSEGCNVVTGPGGLPRAGCTLNLGAAADGDACEFDEDCDIGLLCTEAAVHAVPCPNDAASCCTAICEPIEAPCIGVEGTCFNLNIDGQNTTGYCGGMP